MASNYPSSLPVKDAAGANLSSNPHSALHDDMYDDIVAIATELGTDPKGTSASVKARLDAVEIGAWTSWTPVVRQNASVVASTNNSSKYTRIGRTIHYNIDVTINATGYNGSPFDVSLPVEAALADGVYNGAGYFRDDSENPDIYYPMIPFAYTTTAIRFKDTSQIASSAPNLVGVGLGSGDTILFGGTYEAAS